MPISTRYKENGIFSVSYHRITDVFNRLLSTNRLTLAHDEYFLGLFRVDMIQIKAQYYLEDDKTAHLLLTNDTRRSIGKFVKISLGFAKKFANRLKKRWTSGMTSNLASELLKLQHLIELLKSTKVFAAGSFPLQVYLDEDWLDSDLDLFFLDEIDFHTIKKCLDSHWGWVGQKYISQKDSPNYMFNKNIKVYQYTLKNGFRIQLILRHNINPPYDFRGYSVYKLLDEFDFDFCKIAYSFKESQLRILNLDSIRTKSCTYQAPTDLKRLTKYQSRGFTLKQRSDQLT